MSFQIKHGLFKLDFDFDFNDYHAIIGVTVDADIYTIQKRYKHIARILHPDTCSAVSASEKENAEQLLSKLVNPAYDQLSKTSNLREHLTLLELLARRLARQTDKITIKSKLAKQFNQASGDLHALYSNYVQKLAAIQYDTLEKAIDVIGILSELNMVYLIRKETGSSILKSALPTGKTQNETGGKSEDDKGLIKRESLVDPYMRRATTFLADRNFNKAILELRSALHLDPKNANCHSLLGMVYLKQNLVTMAKIHINKALELDPKNARALQGKEILDKLPQKAADSKATTDPQSPQIKANKPGGGLFGGKKN